jgi:hypothetical protein
MFVYLWLSVLTLTLLMLMNSSAPITYVHTLDIYVCGTVLRGQLSVLWIGQQSLSMCGCVMASTAVWSNKQAASSCRLCCLSVCLASWCHVADSVAVVSSQWVIFTVSWLVHIVGHRDHVTNFDAFCDRTVCMCALVSGFVHQQLCATLAHNDSQIYVLYVYMCVCVCVLSWKSYVNGNHLKVMRFVVFLVFIACTIALLCRKYLSSNI